MNRNKSILAVLFAVVLIAGACGRRDEAGSPGTTAAGSGRVTVQEVQLGNQLNTNKSVVTPMDNFGPTDTIYVSVRTTGAAAGTRLTARWTYEGGQVIDETSETVSTDGITEFHISKPDGWPTGTYRVEILANGQSQSSRTFRVS